MIFENEVSSEKLSGSIMSFKGCPNKCREGYYVDPYAHKRVKCKYCEGIRKRIAKEKVTVDDGKSAKDMLNLPDSFVGYGSFEFDSIITPSQRKLMTDESVQEIEGYLSLIFNNMSIGVMPENSGLINLGLNAYPCNFIYPYLMRAYIEGVSTAPYVTARDVFLMLQEETDKSAYILPSGISYTYKELLDKDACVVHITTGASPQHIRAVKGLMQMRAHTDRSTLLFTDAWYTSGNNRDELYLKYAIESLYDEEVISKAVAWLYKVVYKQKTKRASNQPVIGMSAEAFRGLLS